jgi:hypothetical protein
MHSPTYSIQANISLYVEIYCTSLQIRLGQLALSHKALVKPIYKTFKWQHKAYIHFAQ